MSSPPWRQEPLSRGLVRKRFARCRCRFPPFGEQRAIASVLGALDDKIDLNRRMNDTLEAMTRAIFKDWFVNFGPVRAKMEGVHPRPRARDRGAFSSPFRWGRVTEGWNKEPLLAHARLISGGTPRTDVTAYWGGEIRWASAKDVSQCGEAFLIETERTISKRGLNESATWMISAFATVVVARGATTGRYCMFAREMAMNQTCYALESRSYPFWLNCTFHSLVEGLVSAAQAPSSTPLLPRPSTGR